MLNYGAEIKDLRNVQGLQGRYVGRPCPVLTVETVEVAERSLPQLAAEHRIQTLICEVLPKFYIFLQKPRNYGNEQSQ